MRKDDVPAVTRTLAILERVAGQPVDARELHRALRIPLASLYRILNQLLAADILRQNASGLYYLGYGLLKLGYNVRAQSDLVHAARPVLQTISRQTGQMSELSVPVSQLRYLKLEVWQTATSPLRLRSNAGHAVTISHRTAIGMAYLVFGGPQRLERYLKEKVQKEPALADRLRRIAVRCGRLGYIAQEQHTPAGIARLAVPFYHPASGGLGGTLSIVAEAGRLTPAAAARWAPLLRSQVPRIEAAL